eukprot:SAG31_NODE_3036_length_4763_cov_3.456046_2_plen_127_part_00
MSEYYGLTEISNLDRNASTVLAFRDNHVPDALLVSTGDIGERHEGILVNITGFCSRNDLGHGEWEINDGSGPTIVDDQLFMPDEAPSVGIRYTVLGVGSFTYGAYKVEALQIAMASSAVAPPHTGG